MRKKKTALVFGTFDGLHDGHRYFLREARKRGNYLVAVVAEDAVVKKLKGRAPCNPLAGRLAGLRATGLVDEAVPGDNALGSWNAVKKYSPDIVCLGYDQTELEKALREYIQKKRLPLALIKIDAREPSRLHSSLLN